MLMRAARAPPGSSASRRLRLTLGGYRPPRFPPAVVRHLVACHLCCCKAGPGWPVTRVGGGEQHRACGQRAHRARLQNWLGGPWTQWAQRTKWIARRAARPSSAAESARRAGRRGRAAPATPGRLCRCGPCKQAARQRLQRADTWPTTL